MADDCALLFDREDEVVADDFSVVGVKSFPICKVVFDDDRVIRELVCFKICSETGRASNASDLFDFTPLFRSSVLAGGNCTGGVDEIEVVDRLVD